MWRLDVEELSGQSAKVANLTSSVSVKPGVTLLLSSTLSLLLLYDVNDNLFCRIMSAYGLLADSCKLQTKNKPPENFRGNTIGKPSKGTHSYVTLSDR